MTLHNYSEEGKVMSKIVGFLLIVFALAIVAAAIWVAWYIALQFQVAAKDKGYIEKKYFWLCFLLGMVGYLLVVALPDRGKAAKTVNDDLPDL